LIKARSVLSENFGRIFVRFGTPISLRQHVKVLTRHLSLLTREKERERERKKERGRGRKRKR
jgi:glycerol-3-phosphate O-acyltransferase